ncbi:hypothetical protein VNI00_013482 [Paramarasmius palmivorus]|uniref:MYND-type domain-containing protein n=1 Tax=Paramarasmius palmivorus TaxID=297713 RepID=A0AAW0BZB0_9AGAR
MVGADSLLDDDPYPYNGSRTNRNDPILPAKSLPSLGRAGDARVPRSALFYLQSPPATFPALADTLDQTRHHSVLALRGLSAFLDQEIFKDTLRTRLLLAPLTDRQVWSDVWGWIKVLVASLILDLLPSSTKFQELQQQVLDTVSRILLALLDCPWTDRYHRVITAEKDVKEWCAHVYISVVGYTHLSLSSLASISQAQSWGARPAILKRTLISTSSSSSSSSLPFPLVLNKHDPKGLLDILGFRLQAYLKAEQLDIAEVHALQSLIVHIDHACPDIARQTRPSSVRLLTQTLVTIIKHFIRGLLTASCDFWRVVRDCTWVLGRVFMAPCGSNWVIVVLKESLLQTAMLLDCWLAQSYTGHEDGCTGCTLLCLLNEAFLGPLLSHLFVPAVLRYIRQIWHNSGGIPSLPRRSEHNTLSEFWAKLEKYISYLTKVRLQNPQSLGVCGNKMCKQEVFRKNDCNAHEASNDHPADANDVHEDDDNRRLCSGCLSHVYCSRDCQREAWGEHKTDCMKQVQLHRDGTISPRYVDWRLLFYHALDLMLSNADDIRRLSGPGELAVLYIATLPGELRTLPVDTFKRRYPNWVDKWLPALTSLSYIIVQHPTQGLDFILRLCTGLDYESGCWSDGLFSSLLASRAEKQPPQGAIEANEHRAV